MSFCNVPAGRGAAQKRLLRRNLSRHLMKTEDARKGNMDVFMVAIDYDNISLLFHFMFWVHLFAIPSSLA